MSKSSYLKAFSKTHSPAEVAFQKLNGLLSVYKPPNVNLLEIIRKIKLGFVKGLNEVPARPVQEIVKFDDINRSVYLESNRADTVEGLLEFYILEYDYLLDYFKLYMYYIKLLDIGILLRTLN